MQIHSLGLFLYHIFRHKVCRPQEYPGWQALSRGSCRCPSRIPPQALSPPQACLPLTLVLDEAVGCQELQGVHFEEHAVGEEVVGRGPEGRVPGQAGEDELLGSWRGKAEMCSLSALAPQCEERRSLKSWSPRVRSPWAPSCTGRGILLAAKVGPDSTDRTIGPAPRTLHALLPVALTKIMGSRYCHPQFTDEVCIAKGGCQPLPCGPGAGQSANRST